METIQDIDGVLLQIESDFKKAKSHVVQQIRRLEFDLQTMENSMYKDKCGLLEKKCTLLQNRDEARVTGESMNLEIKQRPVAPAYNPQPQRKPFVLPNLDDDEED